MIICNDQFTILLVNLINCIIFKSIQDQIPLNYVLTIVNLTFVILEYRM